MSFGIGKNMERLAFIEVLGDLPFELGAGAVLGHSHVRRFGRAPGRSGVPLIATESLHCGNRREGPIPERAGYG